MSENTAATSGTFTCADWREEAFGDAGRHPRLARASVANAFRGGIEAARTRCEYSLIYATQSTGAFTGIELLSGSVDGRTGDFAVEQRGTFDEDGTVRCAFEVVPGSGTGELAGLRGSGSFTARHGVPETAYAFRYELG